jgi:DNA-binding CsgD family transcriptional regulator
MVEYRALGVRLVSRALGCRTVTLVRQRANGAVRVTAWDADGAARDGGWASIGGVVAGLAVLPPLRPALDGDRGILLAVRPATGGLAGWYLVSEGGFGEDDLAAASRMVPILADPAMLVAERSTRAASGPVTRREAEVLGLVSQGLTAAAVARRTGISTRTVHKHLEQAYRKLDCHDRLSAVLVARSTGLLGGA